MSRAAATSLATLRAGLAAAAIVASAAASAQPAPPAGPPAGPRVISVEGYAEIEVEPDQAHVSVGVSTKGATPAAAIDANSASAAKVIAAARKAGLGDRDIRTGSINLSQAYKNVRTAQGNFEQQPDGYTVSNVVVLRVRDLPKLGAILRDTVDEGANRVSGLTFGVADPSRLQDDLRKAAVADARRRAEMLAEAAGAKLGPVRSIADPPRGQGRPMQVQAEMRMAAAPRADVPVSGGSLSFSQSVSVTWTLE